MRRGTLRMGKKYNKDFNEMLYRRQAQFRSRLEWLLLTIIMGFDNTINNIKLLIIVDLLYI